MHGIFLAMPPQPQNYCPIEVPSQWLAVGTDDPTYQISFESTACGSQVSINPWFGVLELPGGIIMMVVTVVNSVTKILLGQKPL